MKSITEITAEDIANRDSPSIHPDEKVSQAKELMKKNNLRELPVVDGKKFKGMLRYEDILRKIRGDPAEINVSTLMRQPPEADPDMNLVELAGLRRDSGFKKSVLLDKGKLEGVIGDEEITHSIIEGIEELEGLQVRDLMNTEVISLKEDEPHKRVPELMRDYAISRIPILNSEEEVTGIISGLELSRTMIPKEQMDHGDVKGEKEEMGEIDCREIMRTDPPVLSNDRMAINDAVKRMAKEDWREVILVDEERHPQGILTLKDIVDFMTNLESKDMMLVNLVGLESDGKKAMVHEQVEKSLQGGLGRVLKNPKELTLHIKQYKRDGTEHKFSIHGKLYSRLGITTVSKHGWDLQNTVDEVLDNMSELVRKKKEKRRDLARKRRKNPLKGN